MGNGPVDEGSSDLPPADGDTSGSVLRTLVARGVGGGGIEGPGGAATEESGETNTEGNGGVNAEFRLVFTGSASDRLTGPSGAAIRTIVANRGIETYVHEGSSSVGILLIDDRAAVGLFDDGGLAALLWSDAPAVRTWTAATCRRYFAAADRA